MNRHDLWRMVKVNRDAMQEHAPDGQEAVVNVYVQFREAPLVVEHVQTRRDFVFPWVFFAAGRKGTDGEIQETHFVREDQIIRVEIAYRPLGGRNVMGFTHGEFSDEDAAVSPNLG